MELRYCVRTILGPVLGIIYQPLLIFYVGIFLQSEYCFSEVITNCLELSFIDVMMKVYELILKYGLEVGTHNRGYNGMTLSFTVGEMLRTILGIKDLLSL